MPEDVHRSTITRPFASSYFVLQKCRQHAVSPDVWLRPVRDTRRLFHRGSLERHYDKFSFLRFAHVELSSSTSLSPFAPPVYVARFRRYYEDSVMCLWLLAYEAASLSLLRTISMLMTTKVVRSAPDLLAVVPRIKFGPEVLIT